MATNYKNSQSYSLTTHNTVPVSVAPGGQTVSTELNGDGRYITGTGTTFLTQVVPMDSWIVDLAQNEMRKIVSVMSNTSLLIDEPFTAPLAGVAWRYITSNRAIEISLANTGAATVVIDGTTYPVGFVVTYTKSNRISRGRTDIVDPIVVNATGTTVAVEITY